MIAHLLPVGEISDFKFIGPANNRGWSKDVVNMIGLFRLLLQEECSLFLASLLFFSNLMINTLNPFFLQDPYTGRMITFCMFAVPDSVAVQITYEDLIRNLFKIIQKKFVQLPNISILGTISLMRP